MIKEEDRKKVIVSADDFGISNVANVNILALLKLGKIDRVSVMMSENISREEADELLQSGVKIDIHLHLIKHDSDYWQGNRRLHESAPKRLLFFFLNYIFGRNSSEKVELKWAVQIEKFRELFGRNPDGIGSHEYIHFFPPYFKAILKLAQKYEIPFVRLGIYSFEQENNISKILDWLRKKNNRAFKKSGKASSEYMVSLDWISSPAKFIENLPENTRTEIVCHPERQDEYEMLEKEF